MNYRNNETCTIDNWFCNGLIPCEECDTAYDYLKNFWTGWAELKGYRDPTIELIPKTDGFDVFVEGE